MLEELEALTAFHSFEEFNTWLAQRCRPLWSELPHPLYDGLSVTEVLELERVEIMLVPAAYDGYVERTVRVFSTCLVSVGQTLAAITTKLTP